MTDWWFDLHRGSLKVEAADLLLTAPLLPYLRGLECLPRAEFDMRLLLERGAVPSPPTGAELLHRGPLPEGGEIRAFEHEGMRWYAVSGDLALQVGADGTPFRLRVRPGAEKLIGATLGLVAIEAMLAATGQTLVHAAALTLPETDRAFLLFAPSGTGKTTTSLTVALAGFGFLTDDAAILSPPAPSSGDGHEIWGLPRALKVHRNTLALLPGLAPVLTGAWNKEGEQVLARETFASLARVLPPDPHPLMAIILLGARVEGPHKLNRISKAEVLVRAAQDNIGRGPLGVLTHELRRFEAIAAAIGHTPVFELRVGQPLETLADCIVAALDQS